MKELFFFILQFGVFPIEVAALQVHREIVEMLFPLTSPISTVPDWSIDGIFAHAKNFGSKPLVSFFFHPCISIMLFSNFITLDHLFCNCSWCSQGLGLEDMMVPFFYFTFFFCKKKMFSLIKNSYLYIRGQSCWSFNMCNLKQHPYILKLPK